MTVEDTEVAAVPQIFFKKRSAKAKSSLRKKLPLLPPTSDSDSAFASSDNDDENAHRMKRRRKDPTVTASSTSHQIHREDAPARVAAASLVSGNDATKHSNWHEEKEDDLSAKNHLGNTGAHTSTKAAPALDGTYKGVANYQSFIQKNPNAPTRQVGPKRAPTNIRTITVTDYAPDVCKDYKQTGFCGFGDSCKFLHSREDYKQGWELDRDWEISTKSKKLSGRTVASRNRAAGEGQGDEEDDDDESLLESIPFACVICKKSYTNPIITKCGHYFCESCALQRYRKSPSCEACGASTGGVFNVAKKLNRLLDKKRAQAQKRREEAIAKGEDVASDEDELQDEDEEA